MKFHESASGRTLRMIALTALGFGVATLASGCSTIKRQKKEICCLRSKVVDLRDKSASLENEVKQSHARVDQSAAQAQALNSQNLALQQRAQNAEASASHAQSQIANAQSDAANAHGQLAQMSGAIDAKNAELASAKERQIDLIERQSDLLERHQRLVAALDKERSRPAPAPSPANWGPAPSTLANNNFQENEQAAAFRRELQNHLSSSGVRDMHVEVRTDRGGRQRVAIVLPDAFPPGKATLAYNESAVKAVMGVGQLIRSHYPSSQVEVEGHTDSDPIRVSKWGTNERLGQARADAVAKLLSSAGVTNQQIRTEGLGARDPLEPGSTKRAKSRNRRVEIFIAPRG